MHIFNFIEYLWYIVETVMFERNLFRCEVYIYDKVRFRMCRTMPRPFGLSCETIYNFDASESVRMRVSCSLTMSVFPEEVLSRTTSLFASRLRHRRRHTKRGCELPPLARPPISKRQKIQY